MLCAFDLWHLTCLHLVCSILTVIFLLAAAIDAIEWGADYLIAAHSRPNRFVAVLGNDTLDFN